METGALKNYINGEEVITLDSGKVLDKNVATSILCDDVLLQKCKELKMVAEHESNRYYNVTETNIVIMHVECGFCILLDNMVTIYNEPDSVSLPKMLDAAKYGVYQAKGDKRYRDWIKCTKNGRVIGHDIQDIIHGNGAVVARKNGLTLDHGAETCNELLANCRYKVDNINDGSHRVCVKINTETELERLIQSIRAYENSGSTGFFL